MIPMEKGSEVIPQRSWKLWYKSITNTSHFWKCLLTNFLTQKHINNNLILEIYFMNENLFRVKKAGVEQSILDFRG